MPDVYDFSGIPKATAAPPASGYDFSGIEKQAPATTPATKPRADTNAIGFDHDWLIHKWADFASNHLPAHLAPVGAYIGTLISDLPASALEMLSAPESIATMGSGGIPKPAAAVERYPGTPLAEYVQRGGRALEVAGDKAKGATGLATKTAGALLQKVQPAMPEGFDRFMPNTSASPAVAEAPAAAATAPAPAAPAMDPAMSPQRILNDIALTARRAGVKLTDAQDALAGELVRKGATPQQAVSAVTQLRAPATEPAAATAAPAPVDVPAAPKVRLTAEEVKLGESLMSKGASPAQALETVLRFRKSSMGTLPSTADMRTAVAARNATGRWTQ